MGKKIILLIVAVLLIANINSVTSANEINYDRFLSNRYTGVYEPSHSIPMYEITPEFTLVSETDTLALYLNHDSLSIRVLNKKTDYVWSSDLQNMEEEELNDTWTNYAQSGVSITYLDTDGKTLQESITTNSKSQVSIVTIEQGFKANIHFSQSDITLEIEVRLEENQMDVQLMSDSIMESENKVVNVTLFPFFGATKSNVQNGYIFLPDGDGGLVNLDPYYANITKHYEKPYYGEDVAFSSRLFSTSPYVNPEQEISFPIYGMVHGVEDNAFMVESLKGSTYALLQMYPAGFVTDFYFVTNRYEYRKPYTHMVTENRGVEQIQEEINEFDVQQRYTFLNNEMASYVGIANVYQQQLMERGLLQDNRGDYESVPMHLSLLAAESKSGIFFNRSVTMTTLEDVKEIEEVLSNNGIDHLVLTYQQAMTSTINGKARDRLRWNKKLGSISDFNDATNYFSNKGNVFYLQLDTMVDTPTKMSSDVVRQYNKQYIVNRNKFGAITYHYSILHQAGFRSLVETDIAGLTNLEIDNLSINPPVLSSHFDNEKSESREVAMSYQASTMELLNSHLNRVQVDYIDPSYLPYISDLNNVVMATTTYPYISDTVPFTSLVLRGYIDLYSRPINSVGNVDETVLRMIEWGVYPHYLMTKQPSHLLQNTYSSYLTSTRFDDWKDHIITTYERVSNALHEVLDASIINHQALSIGVMKTTYSNGISIIVNYTGEVYAYQGHQVQPMDYEVIRS